MNKPFYIAASLIVLAVLAWMFLRGAFETPPPRPRETPMETSEQVAPQRSAKHATPADGLTQRDEERVAPASDAGAGVTLDAGGFDRDEQGLLRMYDEMNDAIEMSTDDCDAIEYAFATAIEGGAPHMKVLIARAKDSRRQGYAASDPLLALAKERMQRLFTQLRKLPPDCGRQLSTELRKLTEGKF